MTDWLILGMGFIAGAFGRKLIDLITERVFKRWGRIQILSKIEVTYHPGESVYRYYKDDNESGLDVPFDVRVIVHNGSQQPRTLYNPQLAMHIPLERIEDIGMSTGMTHFLTTLKNKPVTISGESHSDEVFRGWASFYNEGAE